jgi:hypothetical protein
MRIVETDNFNGDYPDEKFLNIPTIQDVEQAQAIADAINHALPPTFSRCWKVVQDDYKLQPGFEP